MKDHRLNDTTTGAFAAGVLLAEDEPLIILVDGGTASSAELFASALRDNGR